MSTPLRHRHRDSPRTRRLAREAGVDLATVRPTGAHGRVTAADLALLVRPAGGAAAVAEGAPVAQPGPSAPVAALPSACLLEVDVTVLLRQADRDGAAARTHLLASTVGSLARAVQALRPAGLPAGPVAVRVSDDDGHQVTVDGADLLSTAGLTSRLAPAGSAARPAAGSAQSGGASGAAPDAGDEVVADTVLHVVGTARAGTTVEVRPPEGGALATVTVGPALRRPVVVLGADGQEQLGIRSVAWLALSTTALAAADASALLARVGDDLRRAGVAR